MNFWRASGFTKATVPPSHVGEGGEADPPTRREDLGLGVEAVGLRRRQAPGGGDVGVPVGVDAPVREDLAGGLLERAAQRLRGEVALDILDDVLDQLVHEGGALDGVDVHRVRVVLVERLVVGPKRLDEGAAKLHGPAKLPQRAQEVGAVLREPALQEQLADRVVVGAGVPELGGLLRRQAPLLENKLADLEHAVGVEVGIAQREPHEVQVLLRHLAVLLIEALPHLLIHEDAAAVQPDADGLGLVVRRGDGHLLLHGARLDERLHDARVHHDVAHVVDVKLLVALRLRGGVRGLPRARHVGEERADEGEVVRKLRVHVAVDEHAVHHRVGRHAEPRLDHDAVVVARVPAGLQDAPVREPGPEEVEHGALLVRRVEAPVPVH